MEINKNLDYHLENGWQNGCRFGMAESEDDYVNECDCEEE